MKVETGFAELDDGGRKMSGEAVEAAMTVHERRIDISRDDVDWHYDLDDLKAELRALLKSMFRDFDCVASRSDNLKRTTSFPKHPA